MKESSLSSSSSSLLKCSLLVVLRVLLVVLVVIPHFHAFTVTPISQELTYCDEKYQNTTVYNVKLSHATATQTILLSNGVNADVGVTLNYSTTVGSWTVESCWPFRAGTLRSRRSSAANCTESLSDGDQPPSANFDRNGDRGRSCITLFLDSADFGIICRLVPRQPVQMTVSFRSTKGLDGSHPLSNATGTTSGAVTTFTDLDFADELSIELENLTETFLDRKLVIGPPLNYCTIDSNINDETEFNVSKVGYFKGSKGFTALTLPWQSTINLHGAQFPLGDKSWRQKLEDDKVTCLGNWSNYTLGCNSTNIVINGITYSEDGTVEKGTFTFCAGNKLITSQFKNPSFNVLIDPPTISLNLTVKQTFPYTSLTDLRRFYCERIPNNRALCSKVTPPSPSPLPSNESMMRLLPSEAPTEECLCGTTQIPCTQKSGIPLDDNNPQDTLQICCHGRCHFQGVSPIPPSDNTENAQIAFIRRSSSFFLWLPFLYVCLFLTILLCFLTSTIWTPYTPIFLENYLMYHNEPEISTAHAEQRRFWNHDSYIEGQRERGLLKENPDTISLMPLEPSKEEENEEEEEAAEEQVRDKIAELSLPYNLLPQLEAGNESPQRKDSNDDNDDDDEDGDQEEEDKDKEKRREEEMNASDNRRTKMVGNKTSIRQMKDLQGVHFQQPSGNDSSPTQLSITENLTQKRLKTIKIKPSTIRIKSNPSLTQTNRSVVFSSAPIQVREMTNESYENF